MEFIWPAAANPTPHPEIIPTVGAGYRGAPMKQWESFIPKTLIPEAILGDYTAEKSPEVEFLSRRRLAQGGSVCRISVSAPRSQAAPHDLDGYPLLDYLLEWRQSYDRGPALPQNRMHRSPAPVV